MSILTMHHGLMAVKEKPSNFLFLCNCESLDGYDIVSEVGENIKPSAAVSMGEIVQSTRFTNRNAYRFNTNKAPYLNATYGELEKKAITIETCVIQRDGYTRGSFSEIASDLLNFEMEYYRGGNRFRLQCKHYGGSYFLYNGATYNAYATDLYVNLNMSLVRSGISAHLAAVYNPEDSYVYVFLNGTLQLKFLSTFNGVANAFVQISKEVNASYFDFDFISVRYGNFSNNLQSFTVPVSKYIPA